MKQNYKRNCQYYFCKTKRGEYKNKNNPMFGKHHTEETKRKIRQKALGRKSYWKGKKLTQKHRNNISKHHINMKGSNNPSYLDGRTLKKYYCKCGRKITYQSALYGKGRCQKCYRKNNKGKNNPNWKGGKAPYSLEFTNSLKTFIRKRDNYTCQKCGMTEENHFKKYNKKLDIHHIDYNKKNNNKKNLISVCCQCNTRVNFNRNYWKRYFKNKLIRRTKICQDKELKVKMQ